MPRVGKILLSKIRKQQILNLIYNFARDMRTDVFPVIAAKSVCVGIAAK